MYCYDCARHRAAEIAVAICNNRGAALCQDHIVEEEVVLTKVVPLGRKVPLPIKGRRLLCRICSETLSQPEKVFD